MVFNLGYWEILLVVAVVIIFFSGPSRVSGIIKSIGKGVREYRQITGEIKETFSLDNFFNDGTPKK